MLNNVVLVGRLAADPELKTLDSGKKVCEITLVVTRPFKNMSGNYDKDFIKCILWESLANSVYNNTKKGNMVSVKGRLQVRKYDLPNEKYLNIIEVIAEIVTFMTNNQKQFEAEIAE